MKRLLLGLTGGLCILAIGCSELEIPAAEVGSLDRRSLCVLTGGEYKPSEKIDISKIDKDDVSSYYRCYCGNDECGENVTCRYNELSKKQMCTGFGYTLLPSGPCMMEGIIVCGERINEAGQSIGFQVKCSQHEWTPEEGCGLLSCKNYQVTGTVITSSMCGECLNDGKTCIAGVQQSGVKQ